MIVLSGLLGLSSRTMAGTVVLVSKALIGDDQWTEEDNKWSLSCIASAGFDGTHDSMERMGSVVVVLQYVGSVSDTPPASVTLSYDATLSGTWLYYLAGSASPKGSAIVSYHGYADRLGPGKTFKSDSSGSVPQTTAAQMMSSPTSTTPVGGHALSTPLTNWNYTDSSGVRTYTLTAIIVSAKGKATADCDARGAYNYASASWKYQIDITSLSVGP